PSEVGRERGEAGLVDLAADELLELALAAARHVERRLPVPEGAITIGHALELHRRDVIAHRQGGVEDAVRGEVIAIGEREQLLANLIAIPEGEGAHAADLVGRLAVLDRRGPDRGMPGRVAVEVAEHRPHVLDRRVDHGGSANPDHRAFLSDSKAAWNTSCPICRASAPSRSGAQSNSAHHSAKVRLPSVTGVSLRVAMWFPTRLRDSR